MNEQQLSIVYPSSDAQCSTPAEVIETLDLIAAGIHDDHRLDFWNARLPYPLGWWCELRFGDLFTSGPAMLVGFTRAEYGFVHYVTADGQESFSPGDLDNGLVTEYTDGDGGVCSTRPGTGIPTSTVRLACLEFAITHNRPTGLTWVDGDPTDLTDIEFESHLL